MTAQQRHDAIRRISKDRRIPEAEALRQITAIHQIGADQLIRRHAKETAKKRNVTDRAKRYRANRNPPPGPKLCNFCGSRRNVDIDHVTGDEGDDAPENLMYLCRRCNTSKGVTQTRNRIGVRTEQYNPRKGPSFAQFRHHAAVLLGIAPGSAGEATAAIRATPPKTRAAYAAKIAANPAPTYKQYAHGVSIHQRGAHDAGGVIIHATPAALRSKYAKFIAETKRKRRGEVPF